MRGVTKYFKIPEKIKRMEYMLIIWMQDMIYRHVPLSGLAIRHQALHFYNFIKGKTGGSSDEIIIASRGLIDSDQDFLCTT